MRRSFPFTLESPTIQVTSSKAVHFVASMSLGRLSSAMYQIRSNQPCTCRPSHWDNGVSVNAGAASWAVLCRLPYASWSSPSVNRFGTTPSINFSPIIISSSNMFATLTIASSSVTNVLPHLFHMRFSWMKPGKPIVLETEPDQEFFGFMVETKPLELIYQGPTQVSQVLSPFSPSPPSVLLSGFRSRCHIVIKGAFPSLRVQQGLAQLIRLYSRAGFPNEELQSISNQLLIQHQNSSFAGNLICCLPRVSRSLLFWFLVSLVSLVFLFSRVCRCLFTSRSLLQLFGSNSAFLLFPPCLNAHGSRSRAGVPPPFGQSNYASQLSGRAPTFLRALH